VAVAVFPDRDDLQALGFHRGREGLPEDLLLDALHVLAILHEIRHLEHAEDVGLRGHDCRGQREVHGAELQLLQELLVAAELARAVDHHFRLAAELGIGALGELLCRGGEQRSGLANVAELDLGLRRGGA
jgi:hypothetical protein